MVLDFGLINSGLFPSRDVSGEGMGASESTVIWNDVGIGIVPIGSIIALAKSLTGIPPLLPSFVQCDGQVLSDGDSPLNGQTIPDLNAAAGTARFLRGAATSGGTGGSETHTHTITSNGNDSALGGSLNAKEQTTSSTSTFPSYY